MKNLLRIKSLFFAMICFLVLNSQLSAQGNCLLFNGINQYVESAANIPVSGDFTVSVRAQHDASQSGGFIEILSQGTTGNAFYIGITMPGERLCCT